MGLLDSLLGTGEPGIKVGDAAPEFDLTDAAGNRVRLSDFRGKRNVVLYFYPKDDTPGCTKEACSFRDSYQSFTDAGAEVIGVSSDDGASTWLKAWPPYSNCTPSIVGARPSISSAAVRRSPCEASPGNCTVA